MTGKIGPKEQQVRDLRERRVKRVSPAELRVKIDAVRKRKSKARKKKAKRK